MPVSQSSSRSRKPVTTQFGIDLGTLMGGASLLDPRVRMH